MKKLKAIVPVLLCILLVAGCSKNSYDADTNTVFALDDGSIVSVLVEDFDKSYYDEDELKSMIDENISSYNGQDNKLIEEESFKVTDNQVKLVMKYQSADDYASFNAVTFFVGSVADAITAGYEFDMEFTSTDDDSAVTSEAVKSLTDYQVVIFEEPIKVQTSESIAYFSENLSLEGNKTVSLSEDSVGLAYALFE